MKNPFRVQQIDHVELVVPEQYEAAAWYEQVLGLEIVKGFEEWATDGPLMISTDGGSTMLALFKRTPEREQESFRHRRVAFRVDGPGFMQFLQRLERLVIQNDRGRRLTADQVIDHDQAYSIYFQDPYGYPYEVTTYEYAYVSSRLNTSSSDNNSG